MKRVLYIPLDERPCNTQVVKQIVSSTDEIELLMPNKKQLSQKKKAADVDSLWEYVYSHIEECHSCILSVEMLCYGGLLPSRLHLLQEESKKIFIERIKRIKIINPKIKIYVSGLIMRTPQYNSSDEEPDYYQEYGYALFKKAYLMDKEKRVGLSREEDEESKQLFIPYEYLEDYEKRREYNINVLLDVLNLVKEGVIDFMVIPQDDSALYGYCPTDQKKVAEAIALNRLYLKVMMYPGADEAGATLLSYCINKIRGQVPKVYPYFSSTLGPTIIPNYEDRPMLESLKAHIYASGCCLVETSQEADFILAINSPGVKMEEANAQFSKDITYSTHRQLLSFSLLIKSWIEKGIKVGLVDGAFSNGGDIELLVMLDELHLFDKLMSYKGWNTFCNSVGTSISQMVFAMGNTHPKQIDHNLLYHLFDDAFYQSIIRSKITPTLETRSLSYFDLKEESHQIAQEIEIQIQLLYHDFMHYSFKYLTISSLKVTHPWNRMFEIQLKIGVEYD